MGISKNKQWKHTNVALLKGELEGMTLDNNSQEQNISPPLYSTVESGTRPRTFIAGGQSIAKAYSTTNVVVKSHKPAKKQKVQFIDTSKLLTS